MSYDIDTTKIKPGHIFEDIEEYIQTNELKWELKEQEDEVDDIMGEDDPTATKPKHLRVTIQPDTIEGGEERDLVKGFDSITTVEIKFYQIDEGKARVQIVPTKGDIQHWKQFFVNPDNGLKNQWIENGTLIQHQTGELVAAAE